ncbi:MAG: hypothetical protein IKM11_01345, partial [Oscillospiraceae bacterium]|nr:hypothetical protein [Oscillospiraceae bacterium]
ITYHVFSNDEAPLYIPDTFSGTADEPFSLEINVKLHTNATSPLVITTQSGQLTVENTRLSFNRDTYTSSGIPMIQFNGHINLNSDSSLEAINTAFTGTDETLAVITNDGSESTSDYTVMLRGCTLTQNGSVSALDLTNARVTLEGIDTNSYSAIIPTTIYSGGTGITVSASADLYSQFEATNAVIHSQGTGLDIGASAIITLSGCTVTSETGIAIQNKGELMLSGGCTVSGATYALYNEGSVSSENSESYDTGEMLYNTFILTSADGEYTVFSDTSDAPEAKVTLYGIFKAKNSAQIFSEAVAMDTDEVTEEYSIDQSTILYYVIWRE